MNFKIMLQIRLAGQNNLIRKRSLQLHQQIRAGIIVLALILSLGFSQEQFLPENPLKGRIVFEQKGCATCHSINFNYAQIGPSLGTDNSYGRPLSLASTMWNHLPKMLLQINELGIQFPKFSKTEFSELMAYLFYLNYLGEPGNTYQGKDLISEKKCTICHSIGAKGGSVGPPFDSFQKYNSPVFLAQALWNHGPAMDSELKKAGLSRPTFEKNDLSDLNAYIRIASQNSSTSKIFMSPGNPQKGGVLFQEKGCVNCHAINGSGGNTGPDLAEKDWGYSVSEIAGILLNHSLPMYDYMETNQLDWPQFQDNELADIISFLYFLGFTDKPGDPIAGEKVLGEKGCLSCHISDKRGKNNAPDLSKTKNLVSGIDMALIMWNHAPIMEKKASEMVLFWPSLSGTEMADLYAYLSTVKRN